MDNEQGNRANSLIKKENRQIERNDSAVNLLETKLQTGTDLNSAKFHAASPTS